MQEEVEEQKNDLLSAFNVATFKNEEDDATFWNRLISDEQRAAAPTDKKKKGGSTPGEDALAPRNARRAGAYGSAKGALGLRAACVCVC